MRKKHFLVIVLGAAALVLLGVALAAVPGSARATSAGYGSAKGNQVQRLYAVDGGDGFDIMASVPLTTATPHVTPSLTAGPTFTPSGPPDLVGQMNWIGSCPNPVLRISTRNLFPSSPIVVTSTTTLTNSIGDRIDLTVPPFSTSEYAIYKDVGSCADCIPFDWLCHLPFTEIVDYNNDVVEADETNNTASLGTLPPACDPCGPLPTATPTFTATRTPPATSTPTSTPTVVPPSTGTPTMATPNSTVTAPPAFTSTHTPTRTPLPTATSCPIQFSDVLPGSTYYDYVRCLACRGIVSGYADGTFRPNNNVTRGQLSKIVSNSAGFTDPQTVQMFQDVPPGSTFFDYIDRLASRGYISGYPCGTVPTEPCVLPDSLPYFRPNNNSTRGQVSKIISNSAGWLEPVTEQDFEDVPPGSPYYDFVGRMAARGIISGYACGGLGEPCVPPENRPYFRPNIMTTRGQMSKMTANAFFPNCSSP